MVPNGSKWVYGGPPPTLAGVADEYLQWYIDRGMHPDLKCLKELSKLTEITLPYVLKTGIHLFGRSVDQIDPREPRNSDIMGQLHKMDGGQSGLTKFNALHQAAWDHRDLREVEGARSSSSNSATLGR